MQCNASFIKRVTFESFMNEMTSWSMSCPTCQIRSETSFDRRSLLLALASYCYVSLHNHPSRERLAVSYYSSYAFLVFLYMEATLNESNRWIVSYVCCLREVCSVLLLNCFIQCILWRWLIANESHNNEQWIEIHDFIRQANNPVVGSDHGVIRIGMCTLLAS